MENQNSISIETKVYPLDPQRGNLLAFANVTLAGCFAVNGVKIMQGKNGLFSSMPQMKMREAEGRLASEDRREAPPQPRTRRHALTLAQRGKARRRAVDSKGEWHDVCFPVTGEMRQAINHVVVGEYQRARLNPDRNAAQNRPTEARMTTPPIAQRPRNDGTR